MLLMKIFPTKIMKTIRQNTFETNSSSTHAYSVNRLNKANRADTNIIPDENGEVKVNLSDDSGSSPQSKLSLLLFYAYTVGDQEMFDRIVRVVENFSGARVAAVVNKWSGKSWQKNCPVTTVLADGSRTDDAMEDTFCSWTNESGHGSTEDFVSTMDEIGADDDTIKVFIFSSRQNINTETYYDG